MADFSQPLLGAGAGAKTDWSRASASTALTFTGVGEFRRGFEVEIGLNAMASADAGLQKFIDASVRGNAFAEAKASLRCQLPLNLFDDFGVAVGAQAIAQAAAGIQAGLGISIGDFVALLRENPESLGLPLDLVMLLLEESTFGGNFFVNVSASAMAYASLQITGEVVKNPGFHVLVDAGLGLAAGVGFGGGLDLGIRNFRRFYGRAVDRTVDTVIEELSGFLDQNSQQLVPLLQTLSPAAKMSLRVAYEIGDYVARQNPGFSRQDAANLCNHCVGIILEEAQRYLFNRFLETGLGSFEQLVTTEIAGLPQGEWERLRPEREAVAAILYAMPADPFQPTAENFDFWSNLIVEASDLVALLPGQTASNVTRGITICFAAASLLLEAVESRINTAQSYGFAIGAGSATTPSPSFSGPLLIQPSALIQSQINLVLNRGANHTLDYADLISYLISDGVISTLRSTLPGVDEYLSIFQQPGISNNINGVLRALLNNSEAFARDASGAVDPKATLRLLLGALDAFLTLKIEQDLIPAVHKRVTDDHINLYFNELLIATLFFVKRVAFQAVLDWDTRPVDKQAFKEALAGVMTMLLGRSLVLVGDGFMAVLQGEMQRACQHASDNLNSRNDPFKAMGVPASPELKTLIKDTLRIGGEVFGPLPTDTRRRLRLILYDVMETLPPTEAAQRDFLANLTDQFFIPNEAQLSELTDELLEISGARYQLFVEKVLETGGNWILETIEDFIQQFAADVLRWAKQLDRTIEDLFEQIAQLAETIKDLALEAQEAFDDAVQKLEDLIETFSTQAFGVRLRSKSTDKLYKRAKDVLSEDPIYTNLPREARQFVRETLRNTIRGQIDGQMLDPIFNAIGAIENELNDLIDDVQELNPGKPLGPQLLDLIVDRIEDGIRDLFGGTKPGIEVSVNGTFLGISYHFRLGKVDLPFNTLFNLLRDTIDDLNFYETQLEQAAAALSHAFQLDALLVQKEAKEQIKRAEHNRKSRIQSEFTPDLKTITILNPAQSLVYDDDIPIEIHLGGVPLSYLGLEQDEQERVLIFLNGNLIPVQAIALDTPFARPDTPKLSAPLRLQDIAKPGPAGVEVTGKSARIRASAPSSGGPLPSAYPNSASLAARKGIPLRKSGLSSRPYSQQDLKRTPDGRSVVTSSLRNVLPGRRMTARKRDGMKQLLPPGITLRFQASLDELAAGINTLAVAVIDPGGQRYEQAISFAVAPPPKLDHPPVGVRLPARPGNKPTVGPAIRADRIPLHYDQNLLMKRLKKARPSSSRRW
jgi:hypothetical protein